MLRNAFLSLKSETCQVGELDQCPWFIISDYIVWREDVIRV